MLEKLDDRADLAYRQRTSAGASRQTFGNRGSAVFRRPQRKSLEAPSHTVLLGTAADSRDASFRNASGAPRADLAESARERRLGRIAEARRIESRGPDGEVFGEQFVIDAVGDR